MSYTMRWATLPCLTGTRRLRGVPPALHSLTSGLLLHAIMVQLQTLRGMEAYSCVLGCFRQERLHPSWFWTPLLQLPKESILRGIESISMEKLYYVSDGLTVHCPYEARSSSRHPFHALRIVCCVVFMAHSDACPLLLQLYVCSNCVALSRKFNGSGWIGWIRSAGPAMFAWPDSWSSTLSMTNGAPSVTL